MATWANARLLPEDWAAPESCCAAKTALDIVVLTALCVGGATAFGAFIGFLTRGIPEAIGDGLMAFAAGVMLAASVNGLIIPAYESVDGPEMLVPTAGLMLGALCIDLMDKTVPGIQRLMGCKSDDESTRGVVLFVLAIAVHNLPEGIAAGVGFGTENMADAMLIAVGIALQNLPEGMVLVTPMMSVGMKPRLAFLCAATTGVLEIAGTFIGYFASSLSERLLPLLLSLAGGAMLYVISDEMIPELHSGGEKKKATYALLGGFSLMMVINGILSMI